MKVLAYRSNRIFVVAPIVIVVCLFVLHLYWQDKIDFLGYRSRCRLVGFVGALAITMMCAFVERLCMPAVLIECDDCGLYIYKYRKSEPILVRYEDILSSSVTVDVGSEDFTLGSLSPEQTGLVGNNVVGTLCIKTKNDDVRIRGIKDVKQVRSLMNKKIFELKRKKEQEVDDMLEACRREREAEEQKRHNPDT